MNSFSFSDYLTERATLLNFKKRSPSKNTAPKPHVIAAQQIRTKAQTHDAINLSFLYYRICQLIDEFPPSYLLKPQERLFPLDSTTKFQLIRPLASWNPEVVEFKISNTSTLYKTHRFTELEMLCHRFIGYARFLELSSDDLCTAVFASRCEDVSNE